MSSSSIERLANRIGTEYPILNDVLKNKKYHYKRIVCKKKSGKIRELNSPSNILKKYQRWICENELNNMEVHSSSTAYKKSTNITNNVVRHQKSTYMLCVDLEDFFSNITFKKVLDVFMKNGHNYYDANILTELCTLHGSLPQGAITSPLLSNITNVNLDKRLKGYADKHNLIYTRYADDITMSGNDLQTVKRALYAIRNIVKSEGYSLNDQKTRILRPGNRRKITGIVINEQQELRVGRAKYRELRSMIHHYKNNRAIVKEEREKLFMQIQGWLAYLKCVDPKTNAMLFTYIDKLYAENARNPFDSIRKLQSHIEPPKREVDLTEYITKMMKQLQEQHPSEEMIF